MGLDEVLALLKKENDTPCPDCCNALFTWLCDPFTQAALPKYSKKREGALYLHVHTKSPLLGLEVPEGIGFFRTYARITADNVIPYTTPGGTCITIALQALTDVLNNETKRLRRQARQRNRKKATTTTDAS